MRIQFGDWLRDSARDRIPIFTNSRARNLAACPLIGCAASLILIALGLLPCLAAQAAESASLAVTGAVERPLNLQVSDLEKMPHVRVDVKDHDGNVITYEGVPVAEVLKAAGAPIGEKLRGANMASYILAEAKDGYRVVFALPELDPAFTDSQVLIVYAANGKPLPDGQGPFRIVAPQEKRPARWIRMLQRIQVVKVRE
jgi:DMSO/TMAO reductase YedYZ molybdopterin-dependent catalytic subunit